METKIRLAEGKLGILLVGLGAVSSTLIAGVEAIKLDPNKHKPIGSLTQIGTIRLGKRSDHNSPLIKDFASLANLEDIVFGAWDIFPDNAYESALNAGVLDSRLLDEVSEQMSSIKPMKAVFDPKYVSRLHGTHIKSGDNKMDLSYQISEDINLFLSHNDCNRLIMLWAASTEKYIKVGQVHQTIEAFERGLYDNDPNISPSMIYAYAALNSGVPFINGAPNLTIDIPALQQLSIKRKIPICGKDFKTGQTMMKTIIAPGLKARMLGLDGWYSTNILGNRDGEVLDDRDNFKTKQLSKQSVLDTILQPHLHPDLYGNFTHKVCIEYYPPRGDNKEGWDNIDIFGWLGYKMQLKINFLCKDSILAAPICLDLILFMDWAQRAGMYGVQEWLSFYFKVPQTITAGADPEHDLFIQQKKLKNTLRVAMGEKPITHLDDEDYE